MLFLLNAVVVKVPQTIELPKGLAPLKRMTAAGVLKAGGEIYSRHPRLEYDRPDIAEWYCGLLVAKNPEANGALFRKGEGGRLLSIAFPLLAHLAAIQREGLSIEDEVRRRVWEPNAAAINALSAG